MKTVRLMHGVTWNHKAPHQERNWQIEERTAKCKLLRLFICQVIMIAYNMKGGDPMVIKSKLTRLKDIALLRQVFILMSEQSPLDD